MMSVLQPVGYLSDIDVIPCLSYSMHYGEFVFSRVLTPAFIWHVQSQSIGLTIGAIRPVEPRLTGSRLDAHALLAPTLRLNDVLVSSPLNGMRIMFS
jgi:hypothetical protein